MTEPVCCFLLEAFKMEELRSRIQRVTSDLRYIQDSLYEVSKTSATETVRNAALETLLQGNILYDFKSAVDHMRHLLWSYIEAQTKQRGGDFQGTLQQVRMQRVTEMLRVLAPEVEEAGALKRPEAQGFFDVIQQIANSAVDRNMGKERVK